MSPADAVSEFEHSHGQLSELVVKLRGMLSPGTSSRDGAALVKLLKDLREELLLHFAREEEGLFPFVRAHVADQKNVVDRLEAAHDGICGAVVRLAHLAEREPSPSGLRNTFERFERAYAEHGRAEGELLRTLGQRLEPTHRAELAELVRGL